MANRKVLHASLQAPIFVNGAGQFGPQIQPTTKGGGKLKELSMEWGENTLNITVNGIEVGVPHANVQSVVFQSETK